MSHIFPRRYNFSTAELDQTAKFTLDVFKSIKEHEDLSYLMMDSTENVLGPR